MKEESRYDGLTGSQVIESRAQHGSNLIEMQEDRVLGKLLAGIVLEPMFILLLVACTIYFVVGQISEGFIMLAAIILVAGISIFQEYRSRNAIQALKRLSAPRARVQRDGAVVQINAGEIVVGDLLLLEEGEVIAADGLIQAANDFSVNESVLTGESLPVFKSQGNSSSVYKGTLVTSGSAAVKVTAVGNKTMFGKIGLSLLEITVVKTPLQTQIRVFVQYMLGFGAVAFLLVLGYNYYVSGNFLHALMQGLTLAMSVIPEEIPVAFSTFMALGAYRLLQSNIIVKQPQYVETLGSATVICTDKTGTLTQNRMSIAFLYDATSKRSLAPAVEKDLPAALIEYAMWSSETQPFDPMEKAIHALYEKTTEKDKRPLFRQIHEYPIGGKPPMMTHVFGNEAGEVIIAAKGSPEAILRQSNLPLSELKHIEEQSFAYARQGYRVLGVGRGKWGERKWPLSQEEFSFTFLGLIAFFDPPKEDIAAAITTFYDAGLSVKMITGDYAETALAIADQVHLDSNREVLTGKEVLQLDREALQQRVRSVNIFARMFPEAKLKVIDALKENGEIVAMTGDGVNDAPALKAAHIGIAMGNRGSEVAKNAASLILTDDNLGHMTEAVALGRKIYDNLKKAIQYIVSIHLPIILIVLLPLLFFWKFTDIFSPVHIIFLELIMGPTCSIVYENEPMEAGTMKRPPRKLGSTFLSGKQLAFSIIQGLVITSGCLGIGYYHMGRNGDEPLVRTVIFITLLFSNILLTLVNRSFRYSFFTTLQYRNRMVPLVIGITLLCIVLFLYLPAMQHLFRLTSLTFPVIMTCLLVSVLCTGWVEVWKMAKRNSL